MLSETYKHLDWVIRVWYAIGIKFGRNNLVLNYFPKQSKNQKNIIE